MGNLYHYALSLLPIILILKLLSHLRRRHRLPPSPVPLPVIGHLHLLKQPLYLCLQALSAKYGPILFLRFGCRPVLVVSSPSAVQECSTKNDVVLANRPRLMVADHITYNYTAFTWAPYGQFWRVLRRLTVVELLSSHKLLLSSTVRQEEARYLLRQLYSFSKDGSQKADIRLFLSLFNFNLIMKMISGKRCVGEEGQGIETMRQFLKQLKIFAPSTILNMCDFMPILRLVGYKGLEKSAIHLGKRRDAYLQGMLDNFRRSMNGEEWQKTGTFMESLLLLQQSDPDFYTDDVIKGLIMVVIAAGTDTSSVTLEWAMSLLLNHPEVLGKARAEIDSRVKPGQLLDDSDLANLPYLRNVVNETLRLYPTAPLLLPHLSSEDCSVGGYDIPRGTTVMVNVWALHRDSSVWEEATKFKPERFEEMAVEEGREGFKFVPFGVGRRACPGAALGMKTVSLALGGLIQCFEWEKVEADEVDMTPGAGLTMPKAQPLEVIFHPRSTMSSLLSQL